MNEINKNSKKNGYALVTALIFFLAATTAVIAGISDAVFREVRTIKNESLSKQSYFTSESAIEDVAYRIKTGKIVENSESLTLATSTAMVTITETPDDSKEVVSVADAGGTKRTTKLVLKEGAGVSFAYAIQGGIGGIDMDGGASIVGDIYTTGSIRGCDSCTISGEATAAGKTSVVLDQDNGTPIPPSQSVVFGNANGTQDLAQSFTVSDGLSIMKLSLYVKKNGNPSNATVKINTNNSGSPSGTVLASGTLSSSLIGTSYGWVDITLTSNPVLSIGTTYWIVVDGGTNSSNYYNIATNSVYGNGQAKIGKYNSSWNNTTPTGLDLYFKVYIGTNGEGIVGEGASNMLTVGSSYSYNASYVSATGPLYCQIGLQNNKPCDTSRADPAYKDYPVPDAKINEWKDEADESVYNGNYSVDSTGATLGPKKINGNLTVSGGGTLRVSGTLWVTGNVNISGGGYMRPDDDTKSYVVVADGNITLSGGAQILGNTDSHILLLSTSSGDPAVSISGGASDTVIFAPNGGMFISGGANLKAGSAKHISIDGGSSITYDPDLADLNFSSGMANMGFQIKSWKETE
ncbi:MAG: choice-of-anchor R domain-containing protein [Patescibacteria group bacterium]